MKRIFSLILALMCLISFDVYAETLVYTVSNTDDSGEGSLSDAISQISEKVGGKNIDFEIEFSLPTTGDVEIDLPTSLDFLSSKHDLMGYLTIDGSTYSKGKIIINVHCRMQFYGQKLIFKDLNFVGAGSNRAHSASFLCNRMGSVIFENCSFKDFNKSVSIEDALFANTEYVSDDYYTPLVSCENCTFDNCKAFKHTINGSLDSRCNMRLSFTNCEFYKSTVSIWKESFVAFDKCTFEETSLAISKSERFESRENLFLTASTDGNAYAYDETLSIPEIVSVVSNSESRIVKGIVDKEFIKNSALVSEAPVSVDLYYSKNGKGTTTLYLGNVECDEDGTFEFDVPYELLGKNEKDIFSICAVYDLNNGPDVTSELAYYCVPDTTIVTDTISVGDKIDGQTYSKVGVYDVKSEILQNVDGCDSIVMHKVVVRPTVMNYYVKTKKVNKGDGSNWENAMNREDFALYLPLAPEGATFHVAAGRYLPIYENGYGHKEFKVNSSVSIIGGYPDTAKTGDVPDPKEYKTIFTGDPSGDDYYDEGTRIFDPTNDDLEVEYLFYAEASSSLSFWGCDFKGVSVRRTVDNETSQFVSCPIHCNVIKLEKCEFDIVNDLSGITEGSKLEASECIFRNRSNASPSSIFDYGTINIDRSLFEDVYVCCGGFFSRVRDALIITNSTFNNVFSSNCFSYHMYSGKSKFYLMNNTFCNIKSNESVFAKSSDAADIKIIGNIFVNCDYTSVIDEVKDNCEVRDNLCSGNTVGTDLDLKTSHIDDVLEWESGAPVLKDNGGFTPTVALQKDVLADGKSIRFPRLENVLTDQRGESRDDMTCMGAYELPAIDTVFVRDTIVLGKTYVFNDKDITPAKIGIYNDTMVVKKGNKEITHILKLYVKPETSRNYFYVKKKAEGNGTGSSWNNAMSAEDFAFTLPFANSGTKFYVAEGVYNPIYDASGEESDDPTSLCYRIKNNITIYGGYPADAKIGATADPENHPTIFSGDHKGDDKVVKGIDENGRLKLTYSNRGDNSMNLFEAHKCDATFNNIIIDGASTGIISNGDVTRFYGNNVTFQNCDYAVYYTSNKAVIFIDGSKFENISSGCLYTPNGWNTNVTSTVFSGNTGYIA